MFSDDGPHPWKTKKGHSRLETEMSVIATGQAKGEARASIEKAIAENRRTHHVENGAV